MAEDPRLLARFWQMAVRDPSSAPAPPVPVSRPQPPAPGTPIEKPIFDPQYRDEYAQEWSGYEPGFRGILENIRAMRDSGLDVVPPGSRRSEMVHDLQPGAYGAGLDELAAPIASTQRLPPMDTTDRYLKFGLRDPRDRPEFFEPDIIDWADLFKKVQPIRQAPPIPKSNPRR